MNVTYPACFFKDKDLYVVVFPDLNDLTTQGNSIDEAFEMAVDALALYLYQPQEDQIINPPSSLEDLSLESVSDGIYDVIEVGSFKSYVSVDVEEYAKQHFNKAVKKTLTIPAWLNTLAIKHNINFSQLLQEALKNKLNL